MGWQLEDKEHKFKNVTKEQKKRVLFKPSVKNRFIGQARAVL